MKAKRRRHDTAFKARVGLEALKGQKTTQQIAAEYDVHPTQVTEAKKSGLVRHLGFSAHSVEAAFAAMDRFDFDSILFPVNFANYFAGNFGPQIMERAQSKGMACLALKALARQKWPENDPGRKIFTKCWYQPLDDRREADLALRFTLGQPVTAALPPGDEALFRLALDLAPGVSPLTESQSRELQQLAASLRPLFHAA